MDSTCEDQCDKSSVGESHVKNSGRPSLKERRSISFVLRGVEQEDMYIFFNMLNLYVHLGKCQKQAESCRICHKVK